MYLLYVMQILSYAILLLGLIFDIVLILLVIVSILLVYSLLMITVEHKTFESGIMRLIGLSKSGYVASIFMQASLFVVPSIVCAFLASVPALYYLY
jgi:ABC-type antimicrobial peptide transport system permease subunit